MGSSPTLSHEEVAALLKISPRSLSNRLARGGPVPPSIRLSPRRRLWLASTVMTWLEERERLSEDSLRL